MVTSVYIHIPFCRSKCHYCSFVSYPRLELKVEYLKSLNKEISESYNKELLKTLYIGGGTPSLLSCEEFKTIIKKFNITKNTEICTELNPEGHDKNELTTDYLKGLKYAGINRVSLGAQTFNNEILKIINRRHNSGQIFKAVENAKSAGIENISLDFIYGLPQQTPDMFLNDLETGINLGIKHISLYGLSIEEGCYFYKNSPKNTADDELQAKMYLEAVKYLTNNSFKHYEISNFSLQGYESMHNLNYWNNQNYYGFGAGAHGYIENFRYSHYEDLIKYIQNPNTKIKEYIEDKNSQLEEEIFLGFRKMEGININNINKKYDIDFDKKYSDILSKYLNLDLITKTPSGYALTTQGILVSNKILADFLE